MNGHRFGWSGRPGVDRCRCGTERELKEELNPPFRPYWWYRHDKPPKGILRHEGRESWPCPAAERVA